jgi:hypothetical protein
MNEFMESLDHLFDAGDDFGKALIKFGKAYIKYQRMTWVEGYDNLREAIQRARKHMSGPVYKDLGNYCSITHVSNCHKCGRPVILHDHTTYCTGKHDTLEQS